MVKFWNDRRVKFAVGVATIVVVVYWLFTGSLLHSIEALRGSVQVADSDGNTKAIPVDPVTQGVLPLVVDGFVWIAIFVGTRMILTGQWIFDRLKLGLTSGTEPETQQDAQGVILAVPVDETSAWPPDLDPAAVQRLVAEIGDAVAMNDEPTRIEKSKQLRLPFAIHAMNIASREGRFEDMRRFADEVESLATVEPVVPVVRKRAPRQ